MEEGLKREPDPSFIRRRGLIVPTVQTPHKKQWRAPTAQRRSNAAARL
jgi:hypothetical protein